MSQRTKLLLGALAVILAFVVWNRMRDEPVPDRGRRTQTGARSGGTAQGRGAEGAALQVVELRVEDLEVDGGQYKPGRNPFTYYNPPPPRPPGPTAEELAARRRAAEEEARRRAAELAAMQADLEPPPPPKPRPPQLDFFYIGSFGPERRTIAVFLKEDDSIVNAMVGDEIDGKFRLVAIGYESVAIEFVDFPEEPAVQLPVGDAG